MTGSASDHPHDDLLDSDARGTGMRRPARSVLLATGAAVLLVGAVVAQVARSDDPGTAAPEDLIGSLSLGDFRSTGVESPFGDQQERSASGTGSVHLDVAGRDLDGAARVDFSASIDDAGRSSVFHSWGEIRLDFDSTTCRGSFGWSNFENPREGGGSMHAQCEDGATLAATMVATDQVAGDNGLRIDLRDGWYVAGRPD